jgi:hypothetical protein
VTQTTSLLSDASLVIEVETFGETNLLRVPAVPLPGLVTADQHDRPSVRVERKQHSDAAVDTCLLQLVDA